MSGFCNRDGIKAVIADRPRMMVRRKSQPPFVRANPLFVASWLFERIDAATMVAP
jgi:hypothetical protein